MVRPLCLFVYLTYVQVATICQDFAHKGSALLFVVISEITIIASASVFFCCLEIIWTHQCSPGHSPLLGYHYCFGRVIQHQIGIQQQSTRGGPRILPCSTSDNGILCSVKRRSSVSLEQDDRHL
ncbi:hypothetical protein DL96DRAFT_738880 [Flagelloscypha sp. PMI_526]|nr:hypothetical protein DL96DRAFT_738880 [Flagelloscypha sp. PMI_526]